MQLKFILHLCVAILVLGCKKTDTKPVGTIESEENDIQVTIGENELWQKTLNENLDIADLYLPSAYKLDMGGINAFSSSGIATKYAPRDFKIDSVYIDKRIQANNKGEKFYEIGGFHTSDGMEIKHLIIWDVTDSTLKRELEFFEKVSDPAMDQSVLDERRSRWMELCNAHDVDGLVNDLYANKSMYYNHKPMIVGRRGIISEYQYMSNENYSLKLDPWIVQPVNENIAFEIGLCSGSYGGKYVLIWVKEEDGIWRILMDSNI